jgi:hypothetical protein
MHNPTFASSWIGRLRWDPRLLNYEMAQYNRMKMMGSRCIWEGQPVDPCVPFPSSFSSSLFPLPLIFSLLPCPGPRLPSFRVTRSANISRLQSFKPESALDPRRGDTKRVEIIIRPPPSERVEVLEGELVSPPLSIRLRHRSI